jgi:hypothetical protein
VSAGATRGPEGIQLRLTLRHPDYCGGCQFDISGCGHCQIWGKQGARGPAIPGSKGGAQYLRLPECVAARKGSES